MPDETVLARFWQMKFSVMCINWLVFYIIFSFAYFERIKQKDILLAFLLNKNRQLNQLDHFTINTIANLFVHERLKMPETYSEHSWTSKMELLVKIANS